MWFAKQEDALEYHDTTSDHIVIARDISKFGHKKYGVFPRSHVDIFQGPYNELIRTHAVCRLYLDLDGGAELVDQQDAIVEEVIRQVRAQLHDDASATVLCSSTEYKFSKHIIFKDIFFENNWQHMKNFVAQLASPHIDQSVYSRNRCFRMAGCCKYSDPDRIFRPGLPSSALICVTPDGEIRTCEEAEEEGHEDVQEAHKLVNVGDGDATIRSIEPDDLLMAIPHEQPYHSFFAIGCAYKRAGGSLATFCRWCSKGRSQNAVTRQWRGWNKRLQGYGYSFLKDVALRCSRTDECEVHMDEAYGFHPEKYNCQIFRFNKQYLEKSIFSRPPHLHQLVKSRTGSGKTTVARWLCQQYCNKRVLYLVSSRPLAFAARTKLNEPRLGRTMHFKTYLETDGPLFQYKHLVCSIQSLWRVSMGRIPYDLVVADEFSSVIEDMTNTTNKHPKKNQDTLRWVANTCKRFVAMDAHLMDTSLEVFSEFFGDFGFEVNVNTNRGVGRDAVFIPTPQWTQLKAVRAKARVDPDYRQAFADATCMYDLMFDCWAKNVKTFFVCNNVSLGNWVEENYLRRSFTFMALIWAGLYETVATLVTDFCHGDKGYTLKYAWIHKGDGRASKCFTSVDWWKRYDHLQYTLKVCQGIDFNPKPAHFGIGFCYTTPNTAVPRRVLQQNGRIRALDVPNTVRKRPTVFFALGDRVTTKHLRICGLTSLDSFARRQKYFMDAVVKHHSVKIDNYSHWVFEPTSMWRKLYLMVMNERETYLKYPRRSFEYWLRHDNWNISAMHTTQPARRHWDDCPIRNLVETPFENIALLGDLEFEWLKKRRNVTKAQELQIKKHTFLQTFEDTALWGLYCEHPRWVANTLIERFGDFEDVIARRFGKLVCTQKNTEWVDMTAARLVIIQKITRKLGLSELWNSNGTIISPGAFDRATRFIEANSENFRLAFGFEPTLKAILLSWGGHKLKVHLRIRKREKENVPFPDKNCSVETFVSFMEKTKRDLAAFRSLHNNRLRKKDIRPFLCGLHCEWRKSNPPRRVDLSVRKIESPPWNELRYPGVSTE